MQSSGLSIDRESFNFVNTKNVKTLDYQQFRNSVKQRQNILLQNRARVKEIIVRDDTYLLMVFKYNIEIKRRNWIMAISLIKYNMK